ncbi:isoquinoline 1-oxidoreductase beta subunit [Variovorax paradoxus]|uniref:Isoquinoline 1-oxidoreductase beta subunit n=1 Tax=Variovorax paradoxus TaxID=34073 RepID=A0AAW8EPB3_VARPD|nr:xanthine dehydrogenase family protein molybdopterin-binding subunit [Variovorax paradoxus]MDP9974855.1 isoquinoline 1-oxidoreductase beta subunit [Variovorax paradoxus]
METILTQRRAFLQTSGALVVGFTLPAAGRAAGAPAVANGAASIPMGAFLRISADNRVSVICGQSEMGQGVFTAIPMMVAEELDADWPLVSVENGVDNALTNPIFKFQGTGGSSSVRGFWMPLRTAGAAARQMLVSAAAAQWQIDASQLRTNKSFVLGPGGRSASYGSLAEAAAKLPVPEKPTLKNPSDFRILGKSLSRLDTAAKTNGTARYGIDVQLPGMLVAVMARTPLAGAKPKAVNEAKALAIKGVKQVVTLPTGVAVLATGYWAAKKGRDAMAIDWDLGGDGSLNSAAVTQMLDEGARQADAVARKLGSVDAVPGTKIEARYEVPYLAHACMEPMNCTVWVRGDEAEVWIGTQGPGPQQGVLAGVLKTTPEKIKINMQLLGGGFGRRFSFDASTDAALLSKAAGVPVKLVFTREDDMAAQFYRPASVAQMEGVVSGSSLASLKVGVSSPSIGVSSGTKVGPGEVDRLAMEGLADHPYDIPNQLLAWGRKEPGPKVWFWRSVGHSQNGFFTESFIDELAYAAKQDPYEFRRSMLGKSLRHKGVLELAAEKAGWGAPLPKGRARGIAVVSSYGSYAAEVAEVSLNSDGSPRVHRVVCAVDCGQVVNPEIVHRQAEGAIVYGLTAALYGRITYKDGRVEQTNFHQYPMLRMHEMPKVEVHIVPSTEAPGGMGEPGTPPISPAVTNALFALTGKRVRSLPIDPAQFKA